MKVIKKQQLLLLISTAIMALMVSCTTAFLPAATLRVGVLSTPCTSLTVLLQERERSSVYQQREGGGRGDNGRGYQGRGGRGRGTCICILYVILLIHIMCCVLLLNSVMCMSLMCTKY